MTRRITPRRVVVVVLSLILAAIAARILDDSAGEIGEAGDALSDVEFEWVLLAIVFELSAYVAFGRALQRLLPREDRRPVRWLSAAAIVGQTAAQCLPGGSATSGVVAFRQVRRLGIADVPSAAAVTVANLLQAAALPLLALVGAELPGNAQPIPDLQTVCLVLLGLIVVVVALLIVFREKQWPRRFLTWAAVKLELLVAKAKRRFSKEKAAEVPSSSVLAERIGTFDVAFGQVALAAVLCTYYWVGDALCLAVSFLAVNASIPWQGLLLAYFAAQLVSALPLAPGGLGIVEGSLTAGLVAYGGETATALAAVLLYRLISYWGFNVLGGVTWLALKKAYPLGEDGVPVAEEQPAVAA